jgi:glycosyltransferase involved in cell wall biosynthesis
MIIGIDASRAINESAGIARYNQNLLNGLAKIDQKNSYKFLFTFMRNKNGKKNSAKRLTANFSNKNFKLLSIPGNVKEWFWGTSLPITKIVMGNYDIWHATSFFEATLGDQRSQVVTIYDMTTFIFPEQRGREVSEKLSNRTIKVIRKAKKIIAISESTKRDILKFVPAVAAEKIKVIHLAANNIFRKDKSKKKNIILSVGTVEPRKNLKKLIVAYKKLPQELKNKYKLYIVGANGWNNSDIYQEAKQEVKASRIVFKNFVSDKNLVKLYNQAKIFIYPSVYEGFGLPILEAMNCGTPVITSKISSLPEVAGNAALYINPRDEEDITKNITKLLKNSKLQKKLIKAGFKQAKKFSWEKTARETLKVYQEVYETK